MDGEKIVVRICVGTACFVQGGADLLLYEEFLDSSILKKCFFEGTGCLDGCKNEQNDKRAPYVEINGVLYANVTVERLKELLKEATGARN